MKENTFTVRCSLTAMSWVLVLALSSCSRYTLWQAERLEAKGAFAQAAQAFRDFARKHPGHALAGEALYKGGIDLGQRLGQCAAARPLWEDAARTGSQPWAARSRQALLECPDYFPTRSGYEWTYVDAQTGGANMHETVTARQKDGKLMLERKIYAGQKLFEARELPVSKQGWEIREGGSTLLRFPFKKGTTWNMPEGRRLLVATVVEEDTKAKTRAGTFTGCLKVKVQVSGIESAWKYDYYCPGVGRVLTTVAGPGFEHPNTELASFAKPTP